MDLMVAKFDGNALADGKKIRNAAKSIVKEYENGTRIVVIASAPSNTTDELIKLSDDAAGHFLTDSQKAEIMAMGERTRARLLKSAIEAEGLKAEVIDPYSDLWPIITDSNFLEAKIDLEVSEHKINTLNILMNQGIIPVICGFLGKVEYTAYLEIHPNTTDADEIETYQWSFLITVGNPIAAKDASVIYSANGNYKVQIKDKNEKAVKSGKVTFYIMDGSKTIKKQTVNIKNGAATLSYKITQGVKKYTVKIKYNKATLSKKITVKHAVTLKSVTVKKSAKRLVLQATLAKVNGKYLKSKAVTFKFNGKTFKTKTNSKGVAKVTVQKSVLKKLKVGKTIAYQATYMKDTVKKNR